MKDHSIKQIVSLWKVLSYVIIYTSIDLPKLSTFKTSNESFHKTSRVILESIFQFLSSSSDIPFDRGFYSHGKGVHGYNSAFSSLSQNSVDSDSSTSCFFSYYIVSLNLKNQIISHLKN